MQFRLLPIITFACLVLLIVKVADLVQGGSRYSDLILVPGLKAEQAESKPAEEKKADAKPAEGEKKPEKKDEKKPADSKVSSEKPAENLPKKEYSDTELEILNRLTKRRQELEAREKQLEEKEALLNLSEKKIDDKMAELNKLKADVEDILAQYNEKENTKLDSLVKIYEKMKPAAAAEIFNKLDTNTLLAVIGKMKEGKTAPILANMDPTKAEEVTKDYLKQRKLPDDKQKIAKDK